MPLNQNPFVKFAFRRHDTEDAADSDTTVDYEVACDTNGGGSDHDGVRRSTAILISEDRDDQDGGPGCRLVQDEYQPPPPLFRVTNDLPAAPTGIHHTVVKADTDDEDDLAALGCTSNSATRGGSSAASPVMSNPPCRMPCVRQQEPVRPMRTLHWQNPLAAQRRLIMELFRQQFAFVLSSTDELREAFLPFSRPKAMARLLSTVDGRKTPVLDDPPIITAETQTGALNGYSLRPYQIKGVQFLLHCFHRGMSAILGDDMGLGKTAQVATFLSVLHRVHGIPGPHLLIVPLTTISSWLRELGRWAPSLHVVKCQGNIKMRRDTVSDRHNRFAVFITTSQTFVSDRGSFKNKAWVCVAVDEAHILKGDRTQITMQVRKLDACCRIAITGTPVHNRVGEVWSLIAFLYPFLDVEYCSPDQLEHPAADCARLLQHVMLRRTKGSLDELGIPPKVEYPVVMVQPTRTQRSLFDLVASAALLHSAMDEEDEDSTSSDVSDGPKGGKRRRPDPAVTAARKQRKEERKRQHRQQSRALYAFLTRQRHICNHPLTLRLLLLQRQLGKTIGALEVGASAAVERLKRCGIPVDADHIIRPSAKMVELDRMLQEAFDGGHRVLVFANFTTTLDLIEGLCVLRGFHYDRLDGDTTRVERELSMLRFNHPDSKVFVFLITTGAGGVGVTLTGADTVVLFDANYNPQIDRQAMDRAHRIGQTRTVRVYRLCVQGSMEEHVQRISQQKAKLGDSIVETATVGRGGGAAAAVAGAMDAKSFFTVDQVKKMFLESSGAAATVASDVTSVVDVDADATAAVVPASQDDGGVQQKIFEELITLAEYSGTTDDGGIAVEDDGEEVLRYLGLTTGDGDLRSKQSGSHLSGLPHTHVCFDCGERMRPLEPLLHCTMCTKAFHRDCLPATFPRPEPNAKVRQWSCPRHTCSECEKPQAADGALFACSLCSASYCMDCMDPRYFTLTTDGVGFSGISHKYFGMEEEGMPIKRSMYYITCLQCSGIASSSSDAGSDSGRSSEDSGFESGTSDDASTPAAAAGEVGVGHRSSNAQSGAAGGRSPLLLVDDDDE